MSELGEFGLINLLREMDVVRGIGDDCAVLTPPPGMDLVMTADALIEGVHFRLDWIAADDLGRKSIAVNFSDLAAMGALPAGVLLTLGLKPDTTVEQIEQFYLGAWSILKAFGRDAAVLGGDIVASPQAMAISVTAFGFVESGKALRRSGARPGDELWVTGTLGDSATGLRLLQTAPGTEGWHLKTRHNAPEPRVWHGRAALLSGAVHAMIDISDGLAGDLGHMTRESGVGAVVDATLLPLLDDSREACAQYGWDILELALQGGEDYELLMAVEPGRGADVKDADKSCWHNVSFTRIGTIVEGSGITLRRADGTEEALEAKAFTHF